MTPAVLAVVDHLAADSPGRVALQFPSVPTALTWRELRDRSCAWADQLGRGGAAGGDRIGILLPNDERFIPALLGTWRLGAAAVPLPVPGSFADPATYESHIDAMVAAAGISHTIREDGVSAPRAAPPSGPSLSPDLAIIQYTSGSTSAPKGVELTHANVNAGLHSFAHATGLGPGDAWGVWMPLFHDFGLISVLTSLSQGAAVWIWPPAKFLRAPGAWLADFGRNGLTHYSGPNFSFDLMAESVAAKALDGVSLTAWRVAVNGAEQVSPVTIGRFQDRFASCGFRPETMVPGYGMAEATLAVTVPPPSTPPRVLRVSRRGLTERRRAVPAAAEDPDSRALVSVGRPVPGMSLRIVDVAGATLASRRVGEIEIAGPAVTHDTRSDGWLATGDLGFQDGDDLFIVGRIKDVVNVRGQKYHPEDLEPIVSEVGGVHRGRCAVIGEGDVDERLAVIAETKLADGELSSLRREIRARLVRRLGIAQIVVYLVAPRTVPVTSSGKTRRQLLRRRLEDGLVLDLEPARMA